MGVEVKCIQTGSENNGIVFDTLQVKPPRRRRGKMCWNRQRRPQERNVESKPIRPEMDTNMVSFARPMSERYELPNRLILPQIQG